MGRQPISVLVQRRWASRRPFGDYSDEALHRKLETEALKPWAQILARRELKSRTEQSGLPTHHRLRQELAALSGDGGGDDAVQVNGGYVSQDAGGTER
ncbi:hypothetical protein EKPJFOCH_1340 [Methylobacterium thuringiense]|uniref:Uncharacterized protein n=1 Tax=Methylobacterium thuringiense TaxID=1003091 RepID=A0ABQ4TLG3_9HYPH|nr:hypothetical protein EKPJFOCH_1340 [Methylobacterium thuringiense]